MFDEIKDRIMSGPKDQWPVWKIVRRPDLQKQLLIKARQAYESGEEVKGGRFSYLSSLVVEGVLYGAIDTIRSTAVAQSPRDLAGAELQQATDQLKQTGLDGLIGDYREAGIELNKDQVGRISAMLFGKHNYIT